MEILNDVLPLLLYALGAVLLIYFIVLIIKVTKTVDKINVLLDDVEDKSQKLNGLFTAIDNVTDAIATVNDTIVQSVSKILGKIIRKKSGRPKKEKEMLEDE